MWYLPYLTSSFAELSFHAFPLVEFLISFADVTLPLDSFTFFTFFKKYKLAL